MQKVALAALACVMAGISLAATKASADGFPSPVGGGFRDGKGAPEMVVLPTGQFLMGSPPTEKYRFDNEGPQHLVRVDHAIAMWPKLRDFLR